MASALGFKRGKTPSVGTLHTVLSWLDQVALEAVLSEWAQEVLAAHPPSAVTASVIALDGKTRRASARQGASGTHLAALSPMLGLTVLQQAVDDKSNEITAAQEVLRGLLLEGRVVTVDALLTQRKVAQLIVDKGGTT